MKVGVGIFATDYTIDLGDLAVMAEESGFESLLVPEHTHIPLSRKSPWPGGAPLPDEYYHTFDPFVSLSFAAARTTRILLGTGICLLPQRDTITTAKSVASLERLSSSRFLFGVGAGWNQDELEHHGADFKSRFKKLEEQLEACRLLWGDAPARFEGRHVQFTESICSPKPLKRVPILIGGESDHTLRRIAQLADGWLPRARHGFDAKKEMTRLQGIAEREHRDPSEITTTIFGAPSDPAILEGYRQAGIDRAIIMLRSESSDVVRKRLESIAAELSGQFL